MQALVRLPMMQRQRDRAAGLNTAGFISGYRGSPLGGLDQNLWQAKRFLEQHHIRFQPGINEDLAATAVWGSQQTNLFPRPSMTASSPCGTARAPASTAPATSSSMPTPPAHRAMAACSSLAGDDHACKSSTLPHQIRVRLHRRLDTGAEPGRGAGHSRSRPLRLGAVALSPAAGSPSRPSPRPSTAPPRCSSTPPVSTS